MLIPIANRLRPFSHTPGTFCVLPGSSLRFQIFPALLRIHDLSQSPQNLVEEISLPIKGPVEDFTIQLDLEKSSIVVWGKSATGFFRYRIFSSLSKRKWSSLVEKGPEEVQEVMQPYAGEASTSLLTFERLSLGNHKAQDWDLVKRRQDLAEIFPFWFHLGQLVPDCPSQPYEGTAQLLKICRESIQGHTELSPFLALFLTAFEGILSPRLEDTQYQGIVSSIKGSILSPLVILTEGSKLIRDLFIQAQAKSLHILPALPTAFHSGRMTHIHSQDIGFIDFEWTKKQIRRMILNSTGQGEVEIIWQKQISQYRLRTSKQDRGKRQLAKNKLQIEPGKTYLLDQFEK